MDEYIAQDRISELDDQILITILSLLPVKEAQSTCILTKRWRNLWTFTSGLNFDATKALLDFSQKPAFHDVGKCKCTSWYQQKQMRKKYRSWVNYVLNSHQSSIVDEFRVCDLDSRFDSWIDFAIKKRVKRLEIDFHSHGVVPKKYATSEEKNYAHFQRPCGISNIKSLTHLSLKSVNITDESLEHFLSHSPLLRSLTVDGSRGLVNLKVSGLSLMLKFLEISRCTLLESVEIFAPKLVTFIYFGMSDRTDIYIDYAPSLTELSVLEIKDSIIGSFLSFSSYFSKIEALELYMSMESTPKAPSQLPELISLKDLKFRVSANDQHSLLHWTTSLLNASPFLQRFSLQLFCSSISRERKRRKVKCPHKCLKVVEFVGFVGGAIDFELALYFIENAEALEKFTIDRRRPVLCRHQPPRDFTETEENRMKKLIAEQLKEKLKPKSQPRAKLEII